ncbi:D-lactate dehydrogenase, CCG domain pair-containing subunit, putative [Citrifermentans bemidjiense Bem]|uniref:Glycolate oxidase iron-sulfur subunit n=1 Tax=Citrifermentans bemidjiense (strain ATCC BAA-1014 / DSM 16622 / JCM 12645 / Bem) TaxID=404380 RepID=B5ECG3_CITBB|nr:(Fe-S)-binding protein [Citrifermentans bemidjiense]ACH37591.1 D-lactate dehydrogenase, CCG domain pair-containing subunit, putative [Citrifermentans bemidjiense Bem]
MTKKQIDPLERVAAEMKKCVKCGACRAHCPAFSTFQREPATARGKVALAQHLCKGDITLDDGTYSAMSKCLLCGSCVEKCPNQVPTDEIVIAAREALAQRRGLTTFHKAVGQVIKNRKVMNFGALAAAILGPLFFRKVPATSGLRLRFPMPFIGGSRHIPQIAKKPFMKRHPEVIQGEPGKPRIVFFVGCMTNFVYTEIGEATLALFRHLGCTVIIPKGQQCCGLPGMSGGDLNTVRELAEMNLAAIEAHQADYVMTACATCGGALHKLYPLVVGKRNPELKQRLQALADKTVDAAVLLQKLGLTPEETGTGSGMRITYHDPCHHRTAGITKEPRALLKRTPGLELVEMEGADRCCGLGGTFNVYHYENSLDINASKSAAIIATGADAVVTGCPGCIMQLSDGLKQAGDKTRVLHTVELLARKIRR